MLCCPGHTQGRLHQAKVARRCCKGQSRLICDRMNKLAFSSGTERRQINILDHIFAVRVFVDPQWFCMKSMCHVGFVISLCICFACIVWSYVQQR